MLNVQGVVDGDLARRVEGRADKLGSSRVTCDLLLNRGINHQECFVAHGRREIEARDGGRDIWARTLANVNGLTLTFATWQFTYGSLFFSRILVPINPFINVKRGPLSTRPTVFYGGKYRQTGRQLGDGLTEAIVYFERRGYALMWTGRRCS